MAAAPGSVHRHCLLVSRRTSALERILSDPPGGVVCDLMMPDLDGLEFTRRLRESHPSIPVIIATVKGSEKDASACFDAGERNWV